MPTLWYRRSVRRGLVAVVAGVAVLSLAPFANSQEQEPTCLEEPATNPGATTGTNERDVIIGTLGPDQIRGGGGDDLICGEPDGSVTGAPDRIEGGAGADFIQGFYGNDTILGQNGPDQLFGGDFSGEFQNPDSKLDDGNDYILGGRADDLLAGMKGTDHLRGEGGNDLLAGGPGADRLQGGADDDGLAGMFGNDLLQGGPGNDFLNGDLQPANEPIEDPNPNTDTCEGGPGNNEFVFCENQPSES